MTDVSSTDRLPQTADYPHAARITQAILSVWPEHARYLQINFAARDSGLMGFTERLSEMICRLGQVEPGGLEHLSQDYRYLCQQIVLPEELYFRRRGRYRLERFEDALATVYSDRTFMTRYMNGLLVSDAIWINHCQAMRHYCESFLQGLPAGADVLEIGPGHGLLLALADSVAHLGSLTAWDISDASLALAAKNLGILGAKRQVTFEKRDIFAPESRGAEVAGRFDAVVLSEVLEHLERPLEAMQVLHHLCKPGAKVWVNVPANSPAPDHLYLVNRAEDAAALAREAGFDVVEIQEYPTSGTTLERAISQKLTLSCLVIGVKR
jgi:2-polyprenyl-3-methyl-5-hydroxy-6-metoxy-1,4-benzoquinol methylase